MIQFNTIQFYLQYTLIIIIIVEVVVVVGIVTTSLQHFNLHLSVTVSRTFLGLPQPLFPADTEPLISTPPSIFPAFL